eukprot:6273158-Alexandrium_andersonii.AAC.1
MRDLSGRVEILVPRQPTEDLHAVLREIKIDLAQWLAGGLGELFVGDTLKKGFRNIRGADVPPAAHGLGHK